MKIKPFAPLLALTTACLFIACQQQPSPDLDQTNLELAKTRNEKITALWNTGDAALADEIYAPDFKRTAPNGSTNNLEEFKTYFAGIKSSYADLRLNVNETVVKGDRMIFTWTLKAINTGKTAPDQPAVGKKFSIEGITIATMKDGKVTEERVYWDRLNFYEQMGFTLLPPQPTSAATSAAETNK